MRKSWIALLLALVCLGGIMSSLACGRGEPTPTAQAPAQGAGQQAETASYRITLQLGPAVTAPTSDQFEGAQEGGAMALMAQMALADQGQPVNHHLQVHVYNKVSGVAVKDVTPVVSITDRSTGAPRGLPSTTACLLTRHKVFPHFGDNLYLPPGKYTVTVAVGADTATFDVSL